MCSSKDKQLKPGGENAALYVVLIAAAAMCIFVVGLYVYKFNGPLSSELGDWAEFGDYLGGVLGASFSFLSLISILYTVSLQKKN